MGTRTTWIFGYGSLVDLGRLAPFLGRELAPKDVAFGHLHGYRRAWNLATDNRLDLPGYKMYLDPVTGERPEVFVTFLNLRRVAPSGVGPQGNGSEQRVNGVAFRVTPKELQKIRDRERNYRLTEVTESWRAEERGRELPGRLLTSLGKPEALARFHEGWATQRAVIRTSYRQIVHEAFRQRSEAWWSQYRATTDSPAVPERELVRVDLP